MHSCCCRKKQCFVFCLLYWWRILVWHWCVVLAFEFLGLFLRVSPSLLFLPWLGVCFDGSVHWESLVNAMTSDSWGTHVCVWDTESKAMSPGRQTKALRRRAFEELARLVVCFSALLPPNSSGCSRRLTSVGRFTRAFVRQKRDHSGRALAFSKNLLGGSKERETEGRREGERWGQRESKIKKKGERIFSLWQVPASLSCPPCLDLRVSQLGLVCVCAAKCWLISPRISPP